MAVRIASNISSLNAQRRVNDATRDLFKVSERLSSGLRINKAADDAAGLQISEGLRSDSKVLAQAVRNVNDGLSIAAIAEGAVSQLSNIVIRQLELAEQSASGTYSAKQRLALNREANALVREYNRIVQSTTFNGLRILDGTDDSVRIQSGYGVNSSTLYNIGQAFGQAAGSAQYGNIVSSPATAESTSITFNAVSGTAGSPETSLIRVYGVIENGDYFILDDGTNRYYFWFNVDSGGSDPGLEGTGIEIGIGSGGTAQEYIDAIRGAINGSGGNFTADDQMDGQNILVTNTFDGDTEDSSYYSAYGGFDSQAQDQGVTAGTNYTPGGYFRLNDGTTTHIFWFNVDGSGSAPGVAGTKHQINITTGQSGATVAALVAAAITGAGGFSVNPSGANLIVTNTATGSATDYSNVTGSGIASGSILTQGSNGSTGGTASGTINGFQNPNAPQTADLNNDGILDVFFTSLQDNKIWAALGNGDGTFGAARSIIAIAASNTAVTFGDVNGDGIIDIVASQQPGFPAMLALGNGNGTFRAPTSIATGLSGTIFSLDLMDLNGDGALDLITRRGTEFAVMLGNNNGTFKSPINFFSSNGGGFDVADMNGDGVLDIVAGVTGNVFEVLIGNGNGTFRAGYTPGAPVGNQSDVRLADLNGDGYMDVISSQNGGVPSNRVFLGNGNGTFKAGVTFTSVGSLTYLTTADLNGDGKLDMITSSNSTGYTLTFLGNGDGTFSIGNTYNNGGSVSYGQAVGDFNGDGVPDFIGSNYTAVGSLAIWLGNADSTGRRNNYIEDVDLLTVQGAREAITKTKTILTRINRELGNLGAIESRLQTSANVLINQRTNYESAKSAITDADVAQDAAGLLRTRILQRAAASVLAQANQQPALAIRLLRRQ